MGLAYRAWNANLVAMSIAIAFIDNVGRRKLLLAGLVGMAVSLAVVEMAFGSLVVFTTSFAFPLGPVVWTVINEVFPARIRSRGVALATAVNWGSAYLVSQFFLSLVQAIGIATTFWLFAVLCIIGWVWVYVAAPETKRQSLEEIQQMWSSGK